MHILNPHVQQSNLLAAALEQQPRKYVIIIKVSLVFHLSILFTLFYIIHAKKKTSMELLHQKTSFFLLSSNLLPMKNWN